MHILANAHKIEVRKATARDEACSCEGHMCNSYETQGPEDEAHTCVVLIRTSDTQGSACYEKMYDKGRIHSSPRNADPPLNIKDYRRKEPFRDPVCSCPG